MVLEVDDPSDLFTHILGLGGSINEEGVLCFPDKVGTGYIRLITPFPGISMLVQHFELNEDLTIKRLESASEDRVLIFSFRNILPTKTAPFSEVDPKGIRVWPSVQVSTSEIALDIHVPANTLIMNLIIGVEIDYLKKLLETDGRHEFMNLLLGKENAYLYEEIISPSIQEVATAIFKSDVGDVLSQFFYKLKAEELMYLFLVELLKREQFTYYPLNQKDIREVYRVRDAVLKQLDQPPVLEQLSKDAGMSVSKLGRLFRQVFGESIYHYYQKIRMQQAAYLLRDQHLSVSEVGYQLGFTNLSHFSRLFEKHIGIKPKKYSKR